MAPLTQLTPDIGFSFLVKALAATVLSGLGNMPGAIVGGFVIGITEALAAAGLDSTAQDVECLRRNHAGAGGEAHRTFWRQGASAMSNAKRLFWLPRGYVIGAGFVGFAVIPLLLSQYYIFIANIALIHIVLAVGLNIVLGFTGQLVFANGVLFGVGAYATGLLMVDAHWPFWFAFPAGTAIATIIGVLVALPALRAGSISRSRPSASRSSRSGFSFISTRLPTACRVQ